MVYKVWNILVLLFPWNPWLLVLERRRLKIDSIILLQCSGYMAPEYAMHGYLSVKTDVFSYGVLVLEIVSGRKTYDRQFEREKADVLSYVSCINIVYRFYCWCNFCRHEYKVAIDSLNKKLKSVQPSLSSLMSLMFRNLSLPFWSIVQNKTNLFCKTRLSAPAFQIAILNAVHMLFYHMSTWWT